MNKIDIVLAIFIALGAFSGYRRGFLMSLFSLLAIILGIIGAFKLMGVAMLTLSDHYNMSGKILPYAAFALVFVIIVIVVSLVGKMLSSTLEKTVLGSLDNWMGAALGVIKAMFMISVFFWLLDSLDVSFPSEWTEGSYLYAMTSEMAYLVTSWIGALIPFLKDAFGSSF